MDKDKILALLKSKGPLVPNDIKKVLGADTMIVGAVLSDLAGRGFVKISHLKKGGSPFYYLEGQEAQLEKFTEYLNPKDQKTQQLLKEQQILRDHSLELFYRVSIRQIKDFAKSFTMQTTNGDVLFWRYYLLSETDAKNILMAGNKPKEEPKQATAPKPILEVASAPEQSTPQPASQTTAQPTATPKQQSTPQPAEKPAAEQEVQKQKPVNEAQQQLDVKTTIESTPFYEDVLDYFKQSEITVIEEKTVAKNREYEFIIRIPSAVGQMDMFCLARNKKKLNQNDVAPALLKAKQKDMQCFFLTNGEFTKKSKDIIKQEYKGVIVKTF
ncbi:hypothetical protein K9M74_02085 [Candidatus Woesearchaeota archaeon]|nr:hypothetical protein [Candidatus Woesearchaeota archaeon]